MSYAAQLWASVPDSITENDRRLVATLLVGIYVFYAVVSAFLAISSNAAPLNAVANTLGSITFLIAAYAIMALALNLHWGYTGLFNIGIAGFMAIGVYSMSILAAPPTGSPPGFGWPVPLAIVGALVITAIIGGLVALPALQLEADYLAIVTVGFSEIVRLGLNASYFAGTVKDPSASGYNVVTIFGYTFGTGGGQGISTPYSSPSAFIYETESGLTPIGEVVYGWANTIGVNNSVVLDATYGLFLLVVVVTVYYVLLSRIAKSPFGRVLKAIREDELVARSLGKDTRLFKIKVFMLGSALMGLGGILWQGSYGFVNPNTFRPIVTFYIFTALIVGGAGSNTGSVVGGAVFASLLLEGPRRLAAVVNALAQTVFGGGGLPAPNNFYAAMVTWNPLAWFGYAVDGIANLKFIFLGAVLVYLMQNRSEGLLGHRTERAASVDLLERDRPEDPAHTTAGDSDG